MFYWADRTLVVAGYVALIAVCISGFMANGFWPLVTFRFNPELDVFPDYAISLTIFIVAMTFIVALWHRIAGSYISPRNGGVVCMGLITCVAYEGFYFSVRIGGR